jgi:DNA-binding MarR family transcriptional regulator
MTAPTAGPVNGQDINVAARATRGVLDRLLADAGCDFNTWIGLLLVAQAGGRVPRAELPAILATPLSLDTDTAELAIRRMVGRGWYREADGDTIELTAEGLAFYERLRDRSTAVAGELYVGMDPTELATAKRVLTEMTQRALAHSGQ